MKEQSPEEIFSLRAESITSDLLALTDTINPLTRDAARYIFEIGGSRGRGIIFELQHEFLGGPEEYRREGALVVEAGHGISLIDNDLLDEHYVSEEEVDSLRRGCLPTHRARGFPEAIAAASALQQLGTYLLQKTASHHGRTSEESVELQEDLFYTINIMWDAQLRDIIGKENKIPQDLEFVINNKNGIWPYAHQLAGKLTRKRGSEISNLVVMNQLANLGRNSGRAHQGRDDLVDFVMDTERGSWAHHIGLDAAYAELAQLQTELLGDLDLLVKKVKEADPCHYERVQSIVPLLAHGYTIISTPKISLEEMKEEVARYGKQ